MNTPVWLTPPDNPNFPLDYLIYVAGNIREDQALFEELPGSPLDARDADTQVSTQFEESGTLFA